MTIPKVKIKKSLLSRSARVLSRLIALTSKEYDPIDNPFLLKRLSSYASVIIGREVRCEWGEENHTVPPNVITLNPRDPPNASAEDRKIVLDAVLEHEIRGHWLHTSSQVYKEVCDLAAGRGTEAQRNEWSDPKLRARRGAIRPLFNLIEDGRVETLLRWDNPEVYRLIIAADQIRPRWKSQKHYPSANKAYKAEVRKTGNKPVISCPTCGQNSALQGIECESCFTEKYRWEQITGMLLMAAIPPHVPPSSLGEPEVQNALIECLPSLSKSLRGTSQDSLDAAHEILSILIEKGMVPQNPELEHLEVDEAEGNEIAGEESIGESLSSSAEIAKDHPSSQDNDGENKGASLQQEAKTFEYTEDTGKNENSDKNFLIFMQSLAEPDLKDHDFTAELDINELRERAQSDQESIEEDWRSEEALKYLLAINGISGGPGIDLVNIYRTPLLNNVYQFLRNRNLERGQRFAHEIVELLSKIMQPQRYQRTGRLDRKQLVNAVARGKKSVFITPKKYYRLDLAVSISVDVSGSMDLYNVPFKFYSQTLLVPQLADAVITCAIGLEKLGSGFEIRAFGSFQWLAKGFYDQDMDGIGGLPGLDRGGTEMTSAVNYSRIALLGRQEKNRLMVIMTDGVPCNPATSADQIRLAKLQGIKVLGVLFANNTEDRQNTDPAMCKLFGIGGFTVIHALDEFPSIIGQAIKNLVRGRTVL